MLIFVYFIENSLQNSLNAWSLEPIKITNDTDGEQHRLFLRPRIRKRVGYSAVTGRFIIKAAIRSRNNEAV